MKQQIRELYSSNTLRNFASVGFIQGLSLLLPLLTIPYLLQVVGADGFALINLALAVVTYFVVFTDYGFNLMGTRLVAIHKNDAAEVNRIFSNMLYAQFLLTAAAIILFLIIVWLVPQYRQNLYFFGATFGVVIGSTLLPTWFFQGREKFNQLHIINLLYRGIYTAGIFLLVKNEDDLMKVPLLNSGTHIAGGLAGLLWIMGRYRLRFIRWDWKAIYKFLREGWNLFVSAISVTSIQQLPIIILALFASPVIVGYYAFADKILLLFRIVIQILGSVLYPRVISAAQQSFQTVRNLLLRVSKYASLMLLATGVLLFFTPELLKSFLPQFYSSSLDTILKVWALLPMAHFFMIMYQQLLLAYDYTRSYAQVMLAGAAANILLLLALSSWLGFTGTALAVLGTEVFLIFALKWKARNLAQKSS